MMEKLKKAPGDSWYIYQNELNKACFQHDMAYGDFKVWTITTSSDKILRNKAFNIAKDPKYDGCKNGLTSMFYIFFGKKSASLADKFVSSSDIKNENLLNEELAEELHKPIIRKFKKRKVHSSFIDNI